jgi:hypothetical protein
MIKMITNFGDLAVLLPLVAVVTRMAGSRVGIDDRLLRVSVVC